MGEDEPDFNENHPELGKNQVFLTNGTKSDYNSCTFVTKSLGKQAYSATGQKLRSYYEYGSPPPVFPIFIEIWEKELREKHFRELNKKEE